MHVSLPPVGARLLRALGFITVLLTAQPALAQEEKPATPAPVATGSLIGAVRDSTSGEVVAYATVGLLPEADTKAITGVAANENGEFALLKLTPGKYRIRISFVGYRSLTRPITVTDGVTNLGTFKLATAGQQLADVVVEGQKPVVEVKPDRLVYNADQDITNAGGTAADVLRKAPLLSVDGDGNPKLRGSGNFKVLVNNKPSPTLVSNLAEALKAIPAEQIKTVEVITTPPAKYDGEGTAGIINIILKKGVNQALNGSVGASSGNRNTNSNLSLNGKKGKFGFTSWFGMGGWYGPSRSTRERTDRDSSGTVLGKLSQRGEGNYGGRWLYGSFGIDFDPVENHSFSLTGSINHYKGHYDQDLFVQYAATDPTHNQLFARFTDNLFSGLNGDLTGTYTRTFKNQPRREWTVMGQAALNNGTFGYDFNQFDGALRAGPISEATYRERSRGRTPGSEYTAQTDYTHPIGEKQTVEAGLKSIWRQTGSVADVDVFRAGQSTDFIRQPARRTDFAYDQQIQAAYATYSLNINKKVSFSLGTRAERTALQADFRVTDTRFSQDYLNLLPNGSVQYAPNEKSSYRLVYSRRITRPFIDYLNPFVDRSSAGSISYGNPNLDPELTDSYELSYNTMIKEANINVSAAVRRTANAIENVRFSQPTDTGTITVSTFQNVASNTFYSLNFYGSVKPLKGWEMSGGPELQYIVRTSPSLGVRREGFTAMMNFNSSYKLPKNFSVQAFANYSLPSPDLQGKSSPWLWYSFGIKKQLFKERADLTLNISNPFNDYWKWYNTVETRTISERNEGFNYQRAFRIGFSYRFGQQQQGRQRKSISNDDKKGGGGKQGSGQ